MHIKFTGQAVSKGFTPDKWFCDLLKLLVGFSDIHYYISFLCWKYITVKDTIFVFLVLNYIVTVTCKKMNPQAKDLFLLFIK